MHNVEWIELACLMEATARKPGNVHPGKAFVDLCYDDFVQAARAIAEPLAAIPNVRLGRGILNAVRQTRIATGTNVNLGIVLLLAPLVAVPQDVPLENGIHSVLDQTTIDDAAQVFEAIRIAQPGGIGKATSQDIAESPTVNLKEAMALAADRDRIAEQYVTGFRLVFAARQKLCELLAGLNKWDDSIVFLQLWIMSQWPDTLISRKCGLKVADEASIQAAKLINGATNLSDIDGGKLFEFDEWLRADGHRRNPGTTADLIAATLFVGLRDGLIAAPSRQEFEIG